MSLIMGRARLRAGLAVAAAILAGSLHAGVARWPESSNGRNFVQAANATAEGRAFLQQWREGVERATAAEFLNGWAQAGAAESPADLVLLADVTAGDLSANLDGSLRFDVPSGSTLRVRFEPHAQLKAAMYPDPQAHPWMARMHPQTRLVTARTASMYATEVVRANSRSLCLPGEDGTCDVDYLRVLVQASRISLQPCSADCTKVFGNPVLLVAGERVDFDAAQDRTVLASLAALLQPLLANETLQFRTSTGQRLAQVTVEVANVSFGRGHLAALPRAAVAALMAKEPKRWMPVAVISSRAVARHFAFQASQAAGIAPQTTTPERIADGLREGVTAQKAEAVAPGLAAFSEGDTISIATTDKDLRRERVCTTLPKDKVEVLARLAPHLEFGRELQRLQVREPDWTGGWLSEPDALRTAVRRGICKVVLDRAAVVDAVARTLPQRMQLTAAGPALTFAGAVAGARENAAKARGFESAADGELGDALGASAPTYAVLKKHGITRVPEFHLAVNRLRAQGYGNGDSAGAVAAFLVDEAEGKSTGRTAKQVAEERVRRAEQARAAAAARKAARGPAEYKEMANSMLVTLRGMNPVSTGTQECARSILKAGGMSASEHGAYTRSYWKVSADLCAFYLYGRDTDAL